MTERSPQLLIDLFKTQGVVTFPDLQAALGRASRATTFRYLRQVKYLRSYNLKSTEFSPILTGKRTPVRAEIDLRDRPG